MLSEERKDLLLLEEKYRDEIRRRLEHERQGEVGMPSRIWRFVNSQFGLWLLGSVVLTLISFFWAGHLSASEERDRVKKIYIEIAYRTLGAQNHYLKAREDRIGVDGKPIVDTLRIDEMRAEPTSLYAFPEFQNRSIKSLLFELQFIGSCSDEKVATQIRNAFDSVKIEIKNNGASLPVGNSLQKVIDQCSRR